MHVVDIAVADEEKQIRDVVAALQDWHALISKKRFERTDRILINAAFSKLQASLQPMATAGFSISTPKFHRARDIWTLITEYGGATFVNTETYE